MTIIKPLTRLREMISKALSGQTNLSKSFRSFFIEAMELFLTILNRRAIAIAPSYISKSGKKTPCVGYFWSGCASAVKWGLELMGFALVDADAGTGVPLVAKQTFTDKVKGPVPYYLKHMDDHNTIIGIYLRIIHSFKDDLLKLSNCLVADAFFSKEAFVTGAKALGFNVISRLRDDVRLRYLYTDPKSGKKGRPKKFTGPVDLKFLNKSIFETITLEDFTLHSAVVWVVSLKREIKVVIAEYIDSEKKTQTKKVFFSTDTDMSAIDIFDVYRTRFQMEFLYRDSKQFTGVCNCQSRDVKAMEFTFNMSLSTINVAGQFGKEYGMDLSVCYVKMLLHNAAMVERIFSTFGNSPNLMKNNTDFKELLFYGL